MENFYYPITPVGFIRNGVVCEFLKPSNEFGVATCKGDVHYKNILYRDKRGCLVTIDPE